MKTDQKSVVAEIKISYRPVIKPSQRPKVAASWEVYQLLKDNWDEEKLELQEQFKIMLLNRGNRVLGIAEISTGGISGTVADPKLIFAIALKAGASAIILSHNHPSRQLKPSRADISLTNKIVQGGNLLDIAVLDHIIVTAEGYFSFSDEGMI